MTYFIPHDEFVNYVISIEPEKRMNTPLQKVKVGMDFLEATVQIASYNNLNFRFKILIEGQIQMTRCLIVELKEIRFDINSYSQVQNIGRPSNVDARTRCHFTIYRAFVKERRRITWKKDFKKECIQASFGHAMQ